MSSDENARYTDRKRSASAFDRCIVRLLQTIFLSVSLILGQTIRMVRVQCSQARRKFSSPGCAVQYSSLPALTYLLLDLVTIKIVLPPTGLVHTRCPYVLVVPHGPPRTSLWTKRGVDKDVTLCAFLVCCFPIHNSINSGAWLICVLGTRSSTRILVCRV